MPVTKNPQRQQKKEGNEIVVCKKCGHSFKAKRKHIHDRMCRPQG